MSRKPAALPGVGQMILLFYTPTIALFKLSARNDSRIVGSYPSRHREGLSRVASTVGTTISGCPPYRPGRALISASGSYLG